VLQGGEISTCFEVHNLEHPLAADFIFGRIVNGKAVIDEEKWRKVVSRSIENIPYCEDCFCKYHCAGDCLSKTFKVTGDSRFKPSPRCKVNRELTKYFILKKIARNNGLWIENAIGAGKS
jgi:uncharacterized protein